MTVSAPPPPTLGRYRVLRRLGAGGMAEVFLAKSSGAEGIEKVLVVKRVLPTFARSPKFIGMFVDEAKVAMRLNHPNIVQVYAFEQVKDEFLLAMEFVDGMDLGRLVSAARRKGTRLPYTTAAFLVMEIAKGLDYAHNRKDESGTPMEIVHRDVSPQNVLVSYDGAVKVADFGIARAKLVSEETGIIKGKFSYMSPEQSRGQRVDRRSDVYSLGVLLAELLMDRAMYPGQQGMEVLDQVREGRVTFPALVDANVPAELDQIARRAMAFDREERFQSARSMAGALSRWLHAQDELHDAGEVERLLLEVAPREVTSPDGRRRASDAPGFAQSATMASLVPAARETRERRGVVVVAGRLRDARALDGEAPPTTGEAASADAARVLDDIAFKNEAILEWPDGPSRSAFRFVIGLGRTSVDDPLHAARLALDVLEALEGIGADALVPLTASIGLSRGTVGTVRSAGRLRHEPVGNVFDVAQRLADAGGGGDVLATGEVYRLARRAFSFDERDERDIAVTTHGGGGTRTMHVYRLRGARTRDERAAEAMTLASQAGVFGRGGELAALESTYLEAVQTRKSSALAIVGELGVGKTALVAAALGRLAPEPRVIRLECVFGSGEVPYAAVAELVREACGIPEGGGPDATREQLRASIGRVVRRADQRDALVAALEPLLVPTAVAQDEGDDRSQRISSAVRDLLGALGRRGPTVVWVDALQFIDGPSMQLVGRLLAQSYDVPLVVILCARPEERLGPLLRGIPRVDLGDLEDDDRRALLVAHFGGAAIPNELHQAIVHRAGGNPFFLQELGDALLDRGIIHVEGEGEAKRVVRRPGAALSLPSTLEDVLAARIAELPDAERVALRWLAVTGLGVREADLSRIAGQPLEAALAALETRGLVRRKTGGMLAFSSVVVRHVAYESIDGGDRARMHRRVAGWMAALSPPAPPARLARHHELSGDLPAAATAWAAAGRAALGVYSKPEALRFLARAISLVPEDAPERFELHELREGVLRVLGRRPEQRVELEAMRALAERARDPRQLATALCRLARHDLDASRPVGVEAMLRRALDASIEAGDKAAEVETMRLFGQLRRDQGDAHGAVEALDRALARAGLDPDQLAARGQTLTQKAILLWRTGELPAALDSSAEAVAIFRRLGQKGLEASALNTLGVSLYSSGAFEDAVAVWRASIHLDREAGDRLHLGRKVSNIGQLYADVGDVPRALEFLRRALDVFESLDDLGGKADTLSAMAELLIEQVGDLDAAAIALDDARVITVRLGDPYDIAHERIVRTALLETRGDLEGAERVAAEALSHARTAAAKGYELLAGATRAKLLAQLGRATAARQAVDDVEADLRAQGVAERAQRVYLALASALEITGETAEAARLRAEARAVVDSHLAQLRDPALRERYLATPIARAILDGAALAPEAP